MNPTRKWSCFQGSYNPVERDKFHTYLWINEHNIFRWWNCWEDSGTEWWGVLMVEWVFVTSEAVRSANVFGFKLCWDVRKDMCGRGTSLRGKGMVKMAGAAGPWQLWRSHEVKVDRKVWTRPHLWKPGFGMWLWSWAQNPLQQNDLMCIFKRSLWLLCREEMIGGKKGSKERVM